MEEWKEYKLGEVATLIIAKADISLFNRKNYISTENILPNRSGIKEASSLPATGKVTAFCGNDILISNIRPYFKKIWLASFDGGCSNDVICLRAKKNVLCQFLYYLLSQDDFFDYIMLGAKGTKMPRGDRKQIINWGIALPPLKEQQKIVSILSSLDNKIALNRKINSNLEEQAKALFKSWFIDFEPFKDGKFIDSELGMIPEGWKVTTIGDVTENIKEKVGNRNDIKVLSPITSGQLVLSEDYFSKQVFSNSIAKYIVVNHNDFAYNPARINIGSIGMNEFEFDGCVSPVYVVFRCQTGYEYFFDLYRRTSYFTEEVKKRAIGGVRQTLSYKDLSLIQLIYPPKKVVDAFNFIFIGFIQEIHSNDVSNKKLEAIRDTLLPKLMSGEIEVK